MISELNWKALEAAKGLELSPAHLQKVARITSEEAARWAFAQWDARARARAKFAKADEMLFTKEAAEQATHERVAAYHASRFPPGALVADLTVGIGADLIALAARGPAIGFETDPERAEYARHNLRVYGLEAEVRVEDSTQAEWNFEYAFADPARRQEGKRTLEPREFSPRPEILADRMATLKLGGLKLSPLLSDGFLETLGPQLEFVSFGGECREALVWVGEEAKEERVAVHVESGERIRYGAPLTRETDETDAFFFEADPAAIRAHALGELCHRHGLKPLGDSNGYLTGPAGVHTPWLAMYRVLASHGADEKRTKRALRDLNAATPELKQRGTKHDLPAMRKRYAMNGDRHLYVAIWTDGKSQKHTILERLENPAKNT